MFKIQTVKTYPHDASAFTQGLEFTPEGDLYEGTGLYGQSVLRQVELATGKVVPGRQVVMNPKHFGEGITIWDDKIYQLTWQEKVCLIYDRASLQLLSQFAIGPSGWGLTHDDTHLIMTDSSEKLTFLDRATGMVQKVLRVKEYASNGEYKYVRSINELEMVDGYLWANLWLQPWLVVIDPVHAVVVARIDLTSMWHPTTHDNNACPNGLALDPHTGKLYMTGKLWDKLYEIEKPNIQQLLALA